MSVKSYIANKLLHVERALWNRLFVNRFDALPFYLNTLGCNNKAEECD
jgi:hypothetical protein